MHSTTGDSHELVERVRARLEQTSAAFTSIDDALGSARYMVSADHGQVVATADQNGRVVSLEFVGVASPRTPVTEMGRQIVGAVNQAQTEAQQAFLRMVVDRLGALPGTDPVPALANGSLLRQTLCTFRTRCDALADAHRSASTVLTRSLDGTVVPEMSFEPTLESTVATLLEAEGVPSFRSVDAIVEYLCGFSPLREICEPLHGGWGALWHRTDQYRRAASAVAETSPTWNDELPDRARLLRDAAATLDGTANGMDADGAKIADATLVVADLALEIANLFVGRGAVGLKDAKKLVDDLVLVASTVIEGTVAFTAFMESATTTVQDQISAVATVNPQDHST